MASYIKTLKDASRENIIYPRTKTEAVYRPDNTTSVEEALVDLENRLATIDETVAENKEYTDGLIATSVADWNQNDETASDYVKNRTHWSEVKETYSTEVITLTFSNAQSSFTAYDEFNSFNPNFQYEVTWDGEKYFCTPDMIAAPGGGIGNIPFISGDGDSGEPFVIFSIGDGSDFIAYCVDDMLNNISSSTHDIQIKVISTIIHKLDNAYIDSDAFVQSDWNQINSEKIDFIKNRTHGVVGESFDYVHNVNSSLNGWSGSYNDQNHFVLYDGAMYHVTGAITITEKNQDAVVINIDTDITATSEMAHHGPALFLPYEVTCASGLTYHKFELCKGSFWYSYEGTSKAVDGNITVELHVSEGIMKLDKKYIPDMMPTADDALALVVETGLVSPVTASDGSIYTDENGVLFTL